MIFVEHFGMMARLNIASKWQLHKFAARFVQSHGNLTKPVELARCLANYYRI